jgi:hypothetical protein
VIWKDLLSSLDELRGVIRLAPEFTRAPRSTISAEHPVAVALINLANEVAEETAPKIVTIELDRNGKPIIPKDMEDLFATIPEGFTPPAPSNPNVGTGVIRRNPIVEGPSGGQQAAKTKATVLPRDTPRIDHPLSLDDADESTVAK